MMIMMMLLIMKMINGGEISTSRTIIVNDPIIYKEIYYWFVNRFKCEHVFCKYKYIYIAR